MFSKNRLRTIQNDLETRGLILAAGRGSRMWAATKKLPKCMPKVFDKALLEWQISSMRHSGIDSIGIITGYKADALKAYGDKHFFNADWSTTQMFHSLTQASDWLEKYNCIISYSDIFYGTKVLRSLIESKDNIAISYDKNWLEPWKRRFKNPLDDAETFLLDEKSYLREIGTKTADYRNIGGQYMGLIKTSPNGWRCFFDASLKLTGVNLRTVQMTQLMNKNIKNGNITIKAIENCEPWGEIDSLSDVEVYQQMYFLDCNKLKEKETS